MTGLDSNHTYDRHFSNVIAIENPPVFDQIKNRLIFFTTVIPSRKELARNAVASPENLEIYADGSKPEVGTGSGV